MFRSISKVSFGVSAVLAITLTAACGEGGGEGGSQDGPIQIGASASLTGTFASSGKNVANGYELAVKQINADGGVLGRDLELKITDDKSDAGLVGRVYSEFLERDKVDALLSPYGSPLAGPAAQLADRYKTPMVHSQSSSPAVFQDSEYNVMAGLGPSFDVFSSIPEFVASEGFTKITLVNNDLETYKEQCDGVEDAIADAGASLVSRYDYAAATSEFSSVALKIKEDEPEVVVECSAIKDSIGITRALDQQGFRPKVIASPTAVDGAFAESLGGLADRAIGYSAWSADLGLEGSQEFADAYEEEYGAPANTQSAGGFASVQVLAAAIEEAGSSDRAEVNDALHGSSFPTILGDYKVDAEGIQSGYESILVQYIDDTFKVVWPESSASVAAQLPY